jgi:phosphoribosylaminoimidazolecarboxamide formyltransferase/IMP cyclohydrolase
MQIELTQLHALVSVYYKNVPGFDDLVRAIHKSGRLIISTGGTADHIRALGIPVTEVSDITHFPEMMGGRVKTLHPNIFGGILGRTTETDDIRAMQEHGIPTIDIVVCNLYPFREEVAKGDQTTHKNIIEKIDVGGPSMIRAAAKNHERVLVISHSDQYAEMAKKIESRHEFLLWEREQLARKAFYVTLRYEEHIEDYFQMRDVARRKQGVK